MSRDLFDTDLDYKKQLMKELIEIVGELGWQVAMPGENEEDEVEGLIIGEPQFVDDILNNLGDGELDA